MITNKKRIVGGQDAFIEDPERCFQLRWPGGQTEERAFLGIGNQRALAVGKRKGGHGFSRGGKRGPTGGEQRSVTEEPTARDRRQRGLHQVHETTLKSLATPKSNRESANPNVAGALRVCRCNLFPYQTRLTLFGGNPEWKKLGRPRLEVLGGRGCLGQPPIARS